jgi:hypothetical protein
MLKPSSFRLIRKGAGQSELSFGIITDSNYLLKQGQYVRVKATRQGVSTFVFYGTITTHMESLLGAEQVKISQDVQCQGMKTIAARRSVKIDYAEGLTYGAIALEMVSDYLHQDGILAGTISTGATLQDDWSQEVISIQEVLDECASKSGFVWYVDDEAKLQFLQAPNFVGSAPFPLNASWTKYNNLKITTESSTYFNKLFLCGGDDETGNPIVLGFEDFAESEDQQDITGGTGVFGNITRDTSIVESDYKTCETGSTASTLNITGHGQQVGDIVWNYTRNEDRQVATIATDSFTVSPAFSGMSAQSSDTAEAGTSTTNIKMTGHGLSLGEMIYNATRDAYRFVHAIIDNDNVSVAAVTGQTTGDTIQKSGDVIAFFDKANDILQNLYKTQSIDPSVITFNTAQRCEPLQRLNVDLPALGQSGQFLIEDVEIIDRGVGLSKCWYAIRATKRNTLAFSAQRKLSYLDYWGDR